MMRNYRFQHRLYFVQKKLFLDFFSTLEESEKLSKGSEWYYPPSEMNSVSSQIDKTL